MENAEKYKNSKSKKIAYVLGGVAVIWYVVSMFTIWHH